ncbi:hypothetical protein [Methylophilus sp. DW102]|uniref:phage tail terminator protein n=1 Tax=Methylophilus sp. DW102 TaxID=3095607 RepID=UPI00308F2A37|nr:hypothetical protein MTDW_12810 [Methylophilus sp. DW102]
MLSIAPVITLLKAPTTKVDKWFRHVGNDYSYANLDPNNVPTPSAYVLPARETVTASGENDDTLDISFDVVIAVDRPVSRDDDEADEHLRKYRREVYRRLRGKRLEAGLKPLKYVGGRILRTTKKDVMWVETYKFTGSVDAYLDNPPNFESVDYKGVTP